VGLIIFLTSTDTLNPLRAKVLCNTKKLFKRVWRNRNLSLAMFKKQIELELYFKELIKRYHTAKGKSSL